MIIEFKVENFRSIKDVQTLSFVATPIRDHKGNIKEIPNFNLGILKSNVMYGANASGKSNIIKAVQFFRKFILSSFKNSEKGDKISRRPFLLDDVSENQASRFEMSFVLSENEMITYGFAVDDRVVIEEHLFLNDELYFSRDEEVFTFNIIFQKEWEMRKELINPNSLFLSLLASTNDDFGFRIYDWIKNNIIVFSGLLSLRENKTIELFRQSSEYADRLSDMVKVADLGIDEISVVKREIKPEFLEGLPDQIRELILKQEGEYQIATHHLIQGGDGKTVKGKIEIEGISDFESDGTQQFLGLAGHVIDAIENGKTLFIDELGVQFHPLMSRYFIDLFNSGENTKGQLFFTTHDVTNLSNELFRRDQIWFAEKNKEMASEFKSLVAYKFNNARVRNDESFGKNYLQGKYGAIPYIGQHFSKFFDNLKEGEDA